MPHWYNNALVATIIAFVSMAGTLLAAWLAFYAIRVANAANRRAVLQDKEDREWAARLEKIAGHLIRINPDIQVQEPGSPFSIGLYVTIFPEDRFRIALLERFIIQRDPTRSLFTQRTLEPHELRLSSVRQTIVKAEEGLEAFRRAHPDTARAHLGL